jgi:RRXRR protein
MVCVMATETRPRVPCHPARARRLLTTGRAAVWRRQPFTIILKPAALDAAPTPLRVKVDPGSRTTGGAVVQAATGQVVGAAEVAHRGQAVLDRRAPRRAGRRSRRQRHTRDRPQRGANRRRPAGWRPPSLASRVANGTTWGARRRRRGPVGALSQALVKFATQRLPHPEIRGVAYQQGQLAGYEGREYLREQWGRRGAYGGATGVPRQVEHIDPRRRPGGSDRVSNLTLAGAPCTTAKGTRTAEEDGHPAPRGRRRPGAPGTTRRPSTPPAGPVTTGCWRRACRWRPGRAGGPSGTARGGGCLRRPGGTRRAWGRARRRAGGWPAGGRWASGRPAATAGRCAAPRRTASPPRPPKPPAWWPGCGRASSCGRGGLRPRPRPASTWGAWRCARRAPATSRQAPARCKASTSATAGRRALHRGDGYTYQKGAAALPPLD